MDTDPMAWLDRLRQPEPTDILVVCTGNVCRSPYIATLLSAYLPELTIRSAGTDALVGDTPGPDVLRALTHRGINLELPPARSLTRGMARGARLIITATRLHRTQVVAGEASASARTFTLKELARVNRATGASSGLETVVERAALTAQSLETVDYDDDLDDAFDLGWAAHDRMATEVDAALAVIVRAIRSVGDHEEPPAGSVR